MDAKGKSLRRRTPRSARNPRPLLPFLSPPAAGGASAMVIHPRLDAREPERPTPALPSELLEEIFLRVASPADLARASATYVSFRRLISDPAFLRRYRSVHPPQLLGFLHTNALHPVVPTHPSAAVARAVARTADFLLGFLPSRLWYPCDVRNGRVLVARCTVQFMAIERHPTDLAVCGPLSRRYLLLPPITDDLLASVGLHDMFGFGASLIPSGNMEETSLSVICWITSETKLAVFIFSTSSGHWDAGTSINWADLGLSEQVHGLGSGHCVYGCFYWKVSFRNKLLKLDMNTMELSTHDLPPIELSTYDLLPSYEERCVVIVESGEGKVAMFRELDEGKSLEYYTLLQSGSEKSHKWHLKSTIPLPFHGTPTFLMSGQAEGYVFLTRFKKEQEDIYSEFFSLEVKSLNIERFCTSNPAFPAPTCFAYFGFLPSMSPRRIQEYGEG